MKSISRITAISFLLVAALLCGCDADTVVSPPESSKQTTSGSFADFPEQAPPSAKPVQQPTEPEILYHPEALWTPTSKLAPDSITVNETESGTYRIWDYWNFDENGKRIEIDPDQKIAVGAYCDIGFLLWNMHDSEETEYPEYTDLPDEITAALSEEMFNKYARLGSAYGDVVFLEDWLESQGFEVLKDHMCHYSLAMSGSVCNGVSTLIITTPRQLAAFKMPYPQASITFYGAFYEDFAPADYVPSTEPEIAYHPEALWTPSSVDTSSETYTVKTENGTYEVGDYWNYDKNGQKIEIDPDQKIAVEAYCDIGFETNIGVEHEYSDLPDEIKAVIPEELYQRYSWSGYISGIFFLEDWLESQGFEVLKDHACHYSWDYADRRPDPYTFRYGVLIITTPRQLAEFKMPYPQASIYFWGAKYEDFAPELIKFT